MQAMPEPPFKNNPPAIYATMQATETPDSFTAIFTVTRPEQLPTALRQHEKSVVIENTHDNARLIRDFKRLLQADRLLIVGLVVVVIMQMVITSKYKLQADWHVKWKAIEIGGKITLTPP